MKIKITADTVCDLSQELIKEYNIGILGIPVILGDKQYKDQTDISQEVFYDYLDKNNVLPKTAAYNPAEAAEFFKEQLESDGGYEAVIHFTISSKMSAMFQNSVVASQEFDNKVFVVDSASLSTGVGLQILYACDLVKEGLSAEDIYTKILERRDSVQASFIIDNLKYLHKGGRCSSLTVLGANLLKIKPTINLKDGKMVVGRKFRGRFDEVCSQYADYILADFNNYDPTRVFITHTPVAPEIVEMMRVKLKDKFNKIYETSAGCTVGAHCGKNTIGILYYLKETEKKDD